MRMDETRMRRIRRLSSVPRWSGVPMIRQQFVDAHTLHVIPIALWLNKNAKYQQRPGDVALAAITHDEGEAVYSDFPAPAKRIPGVKIALDAFDDRKGFGQYDNDHMKVLIKCADCLEALIWCLEEEALGNKSLSYVVDDIMVKFTEAFAKFEWIEDKDNEKPSAGQILHGLWSILHISKHPLMMDL